MIVYFLLIAAASIMVGVEFLLDTQSRDLKIALLEGFKKHTQHEISEDSAFQPIERLRAKALLMIGALLLVTVIVLMMFIKNITEPLQHMIEVSKDISQGDLRHTIRIHADNELAALGTVINDMSSNLQEIIILARHLCASCDRVIGEIRRAFIEKPPAVEASMEIGAHLERLSAEISTLAGMISCFTVYQVGRDTDVS